MQHDTAAAAQWLIDGALSAPTPDAVLGQLCERLAAAAIPLWRVSVFVRTLHPNIMGRRFTWAPGQSVDVGSAPYRMLEDDAFRLSPVARVYQSGQPLRRHLADAACPRDFPVLDEFIADGVTDYLVSPLVFTTGDFHVATWTTRAPGGFSDRAIAGIEAVVAPLARVAEIFALRRTAGTLLETYVGRHAGQRILDGRIRRGDTESIEAAIWLSDMRGFTALADRLPPQRLIDLLNRYFDAQVPAIVAHGGEVLKFIGDGLLAIFPLAPDDAGGANACAAALKAARAAGAAIAALAPPPDEPGLGAIGFGLALHLGTVLYGNIGGESRLDFTCIGPAVNLAARLEKLAGSLGRAIVASAAFAERCPEGLVPIGTHALRGFEASQLAYGLADER